MRNKESFNKTKDISASEVVVMGYKTYAEAARNCRSDEMTVYDPFTGEYNNVKIFR